MADTKPAPTNDDAGGGAQLDAFVDSELEAERARRDRVDARGAALITSSSGLASLLFAVAAVVTDQKNFDPARGALWALGVTFLAFAAAALCGLMAARSETVEVVPPEQLLDWRNDDTNIWKNTEDNVRWLLTRAKILTLTSLRTGNTRRMRWAIRGWVAQLIALAALVVAVGVILAAAIWPTAPGWFDILRSRA